MGGRSQEASSTATCTTWSTSTQEVQQQVLGLLGRKWLVSILRELLAGPRRHFQLLYAINGIQPKVLRETLRFLERDGFVVRVLHDDGVGGKAIAYEMTELGWTLLEPLEAIYEWGREHLDDVRTRQTASVHLQSAR